MLTGFQHLHSALRWVVLFLLVWTLIQSRIGKSKGNAFSAKQAKLGLFTMISLHVQLLLGLALYVGKGWSSMLGDSTIKYKRQFLFFGLALVIIIASIPWPFRPGFQNYGWF